MPRCASHAGSWYTSHGAELQKQLQDWLAAAGEPVHAPAKAIIAPHAGYSYSGPCAAHAYRQIDPTNVKRVFILGPSHHVYLRNCALTQQQVYETPLGPLQIDAATVKELHATGLFGTMSKQEDEDEHSIEMHLPYIAQVMKGQEFSIVPILVGSLSTADEAKYGKLLRPYLLDPHTLFVVSSDFCHWGQRFRYQYHNPEDGEIFRSIEKLDREGMRLIEQVDPPAFAAYLKKFENTICGRHPIGVLLNALQELPQQPTVKFVQYAQSSQCRKKSDSSVSYASASVVLQNQ
eukprot:m.26302 g.26302  ORF g.26302 m.26302 type:complete len:291 (-) comp11492_c0_seq1:20-892(-)